MADNGFTEITPRLTELQARQDLAVATFAGGCFWCMEGPFEAIPGVEEAVTGFAGGEVVHPSYEQVTAGDTGHREAVQVFYNPQQVDYTKLLETYWQHSDPTDAGGQFTDRGPQYSPAIFFHTPEQQQLAETSKAELAQSDRFKKEIITPILPFKNFYPAEDYHQDFYKKQQAHYKNYYKGSGRQAYVEAQKR